MIPLAQIYFNFLQEIVWQAAKYDHDNQGGDGLVTTKAHLIIGLDIGNTALKAVAFTNSGQVIASASRSTLIIKRQQLSIGNVHLNSLLDPSLLKNVVEDLLADLNDKILKIGTYEILGLAVTGMGGPMVALDEKNAPVYPLIGLWSIDIHETILDGKDEACYQVTGDHLHNSPFTTVVWLAQHDPARFAHVRHILPVVSYVTYHLTGVAISDFSTASGTGIWDQSLGQWAKALIEITPVNPRWFPPVAPAGSLIGTISSSVQKATGLPSATLVAVGGHDYLCAAGALGITKPGDVLNMLGTYEIFATPHLSPSVVKPTELDLIDDTHVYPGIRCLMFQVIGGGHLEWLRHMFTAGLSEPASFEQWNLILERAASLTEEDMGDLVFAPFLFGRFFPERCIHPHGALLGLSEGHGPEHITRAMVDALSYVSMEALKTLTTVVNGNSATRIVITGGGIRNHLWVQRKADFLQMPLNVPNVIDSSALGAAILAGLATGVYANWNEAAASLDIKWTKIIPQFPVSDRYLKQFIHWDDLSPNACAHTVSLSRRITQEIIGRSTNIRSPETL